MIFINVAVLIQCHKAPKQVNLLLDVMRHSNFTFFIHIDKKSEIASHICERKDVILLPDKLRVDVKWGQYSQVEATLNLLLYAKEYGRYDYYMLISGQDFPIVSSEKILEYLLNYNGKNFMNLFPSLNNGIGYSNNYDKRNQIIFPNWIMERNNMIRIIRRLWVAITGGYKHTFDIFYKKQLFNTKFYFGSQWWCINNEFVNYMINFLENNKGYEMFYRNTSCPDESFFQTLLMNSPYADTREDYLHYIDWSEGKSSPKNLEIEDFEKIIRSNKLLTRKIDENYKLIEKLNVFVKGEDF